MQAGVAQQWYDELDYLATPKPESEINVQDDNLDKNSESEINIQDEKDCVSCKVCTSPGTSEVCLLLIYFGLVWYLSFEYHIKSKQHNKMGMRMTCFVSFFDQSAPFPFMLTFSSN